MHSQILEQVKNVLKVWTRPSVIMAKFERGQDCSNKFEQAKFWSWRIIFWMGLIMEYFERVPRAGFFQRRTGSFNILNSSEQQN